jgi:hypothetical protein
MIVCTTIKAAMIFVHALVIGIPESGAMRIASSSGLCSEHGESLTEGPWFRQGDFHIQQWNNGPSRFFAASPLVRDDELRDHYLHRGEPGTHL